MKIFLLHLREMCTSKGFFICISFTVILLFSAQVYVDPITQNRYSVIRAFFDLSRELSEHYELCDIIIIQNARSGWFTLFAPIITALCFVPPMCTQREEKAVRFRIFRTTKMKYYVTQFFTGVISGGTAISIGYIIFASVVAVLFPSISHLSLNEAQLLTDVTFSFPKMLCEMCFYGAFWSVPAMFLTSVMQNKYLIMCIPFFVKYGLTQTYQMLVQNAFINGFDNEMYNFANLINPDGILWTSAGTRLNVVLLFSAFVAVFFTAFVIILNRRGDCGA